MKVLLWGGGAGGLAVLDMLDQKIQVLAIIDADSKKQGTVLSNIPIISENQICEYTYDFLIISNIHSQEIIPRLHSKYYVPADKIMDPFCSGLVDVRLGTLKRLAGLIGERNLPGSVAELGVYKGDFAKYINIFFPEKKIFLFDTFTGFHIYDTEVEAEEVFSDSMPGEYCCDDITLILSKMEYVENCVIKKGYFPESTQGLDERFCFVSLDVDLYQPTYNGLNYFYDRLVDGGYIMVHDYATPRFTGATEAVQRFAEERSAKYVPIMDLCGSVVFCK